MYANASLRRPALLQLCIVPCHARTNVLHHGLRQGKSLCMKTQVNSVWERIAYFSVRIHVPGRAATLIANERPSIISFRHVCVSPCHDPSVLFSLPSCEKRRISQTMCRGQCADGGAYDTQHAAKCNCRETGRRSLPWA